MKQKFINAYMDVAERFAQESSAIRLKVGAIVVKENKIISIGYNGTPSGWDNQCEDKVWDQGAGGWLSPEEIESMYPYKEYHPEAQRVVRYGLKTKAEVIHAEMNAIAKLARSTESGEGASMFVTHSPCIECAKLIYESGIKTVYYKNDYRDDIGIKFLEKSGVEVKKT